MSAFEIKFTPAIRHAVNLRLLVMGPSGGGKTYTSLALACHMADIQGIPRNRIFVGDSEVKGTGADAKGTSELYVGDPCYCQRCRGSGITLGGWQQCLIPKEHQDPRNYAHLIAAARNAGAWLILLDSITHEWEGCLALVDQIKQGARNKWTEPWGQVTPLHDAFMREMLTFPGHVIATCRTKEKHAEQEVDGRKKVVSLGDLPVQRVGVEYEFDMAFYVASGGGSVSVVKSRARRFEGEHYAHVGAVLAEDMLAWAASDEAREPVEDPFAPDADPLETRRAALRERLSKLPPQGNGAGLSAEELEHVGLIAKRLEGSTEGLLERFERRLSEIEARLANTNNDPPAHTEAAPAPMPSGPAPQAAPAAGGSPTKSRVRRTRKPAPQDKPQDTTKDDPPEDPCDMADGIRGAAMRVAGEPVGFTGPEVQE